MPDTATPSSEGKSDSKPTWYVTTAIPYVNAPPHIGFGLEMIQADVVARYRRAEGYDVRFQAGTDENSLKNVQAAMAAGIDTDTLVRRNAQKFQELGTALRVCPGTSDAFGGSGFPPGLGAEGAVVPGHHKPFATRPHWDQGRKSAPSQGIRRNRPAAASLVVEYA